MSEVWWEYGTTVPLPLEMAKRRPDAVAYRVTGDDRHIMCPDDIPLREERARADAARAGGSPRRRQVTAGEWQDM